MRAYRLLISPFFTASAVSLVFFILGIVLANNFFPDYSLLIPFSLGVIGFFVFLITGRTFYVRYKLEIPLLIVTMSNFLSAAVISTQEFALFNHGREFTFNLASLLGILGAAALIGRVFAHLNRNSGTTPSAKNDAYPDMRERNSNSNLLATMILFGLLLWFVQTILWTII